MRQIAQLSDERKAYQLHTYLTHEGIDSRFEPQLDPKTDQILFTIWVESEDDFERSLDIVEHFNHHSDDPRYAVKPPPPPPPPNEMPKEPEERLQNRRRPVLTYLIILLCATLFMLDMSQRIKVAPALANPKATVITPIEQAFFYDTPESFVEVSNFWKQVEVDDKGKIKTLTPSEENELKELEKIPYWKGLYDLVLFWPASKSQLSVPLFGKILQGEVYRLITPVLLHGNLIHILFNMLWLFFLGKMIEERISRFRYLSLMVIVGVVSNTVQYLMTGPAFLGYSGIVCGLAGFIWMRQKIAPWEGYPLERITALFLGIFIFGMLAFQIVLFFIERFSNFDLNLQIANSAHITGALVGIILARFELFYKGLE